MRRAIAWSLAILLPAALLAALHMRVWDSPGAYMDAVNPDYMVVRLLGGAEARANAPVWIIPGNMLLGRWPLLTQIYHGSLTFYGGLPAYALAGTGLWGIRVAGAWFALLVLLGLALLLRRLGAPALAAGAGLLLLAADPAFLLNFRTQFHITTLPAALVLAAIALLAGAPTPRRALVAGACCGLAAHGYFIWAFPVAAMALALLALPVGWRARLHFAAGVAAGLSLYLLGYLLFWMAMPSTAAFADAFAGFVRAQSPGQSSQGLGERLGTALLLARMALDNGGNWTLIFGGGAPPWAGARLALLGALALGGGALALARPALRPAAVLLLAAMAGFAGLGLVFGNRLWVQHFAPLAALAPAAAALGLLALWRAGPLPRAAGLGLAALLLAANLAGWQAGARQLVATGGAGLFSDAISRFAREVAERSPPPQVVAADWGIFMPVAMISGGRVPIWTEVNPAAMRQRLCGGQDVALAFLPARGEARVADWEAALAWGAAMREDHAQRDGAPLLAVLNWRAADRPAGACRP